MWPDETKAILLIALLFYLLLSRLQKQTGQCFTLTHRTAALEQETPFLHPHLLWKFTTGDSVNYSPVVANGIVYICSYDGNLYALNAKTGEKIWNYNATELGIGSSQQSPMESSTLVQATKTVSYTPLMLTTETFSGQTMLAHLLPLTQPLSTESYTWLLTALRQFQLRLSHKRQNRRDNMELLITKPPWLHTCSRQRSCLHSFRRWLCPCYKRGQRTGNLEYPKRSRSS